MDLKLLTSLNRCKKHGGLESRAIGLGLQIKRLAKVIKNLSPDFILVLGDRESQ